MQFFWLKAANIIFFYCFKCFRVHLETYTPLDSLLVMQILRKLFCESSYLCFARFFSFERRCVEEKTKVNRFFFSHWRQLEILLQEFVFLPNEKWQTFKIRKFRFSIFRETKNKTFDVMSPKGIWFNTVQLSHWSLEPNFSERNWSCRKWKAFSKRVFKIEGNFQNFEESKV